MMIIIVLIWIMYILYITLDPTIDKYVDYREEKHCIIWYGDYNNRKKIVLY